MSGLRSMVLMSIPDDPSAPNVDGLSNASGSTSSASSAEILAMLEWAGVRLMAMPTSAPGPAKLKAAWPSYALDPFAAYGYNGVQVRAPAPSSAEISTLDLIYDLIMLVEDQPTRRILQARSLLHPANLRNLHSWSSIALMLDIDRRTVRRWHSDGLACIAESVEPKVLAEIRVGIARS